MQEHGNPPSRDAHATARPMHEVDVHDPAPAAGFGDRIAFLRGFVRDPAGVGSIVPSSHRLEQRLVRNARIADARTVVELGPGTGGTTRAFLRAMGPGARLLAIELDPVFHARLADGVRDPRLAVECASAERLGELLAARRLPAPDAIVSGIPFSTMPTEIGERIAAAVFSCLAPGGRFVAYQVRPRVADFASTHFGPPRREWELWNVPPMRVFSWSKPARTAGG
jgi:phosphatidylethanolamine/phosphatidyl-N-methylethanolamine N-methyltransferase